MTNAHTPLAPVDLFDLAAGLRALTFEITEHSDDPRPSPHLHGLAVAAENLASQLADATWEMVENAPTREHPTPSLQRARHALAVDLADSEAAALRRYAKADHAGDVEQAASALLGQALRQFADVAGGIA